MVQIAMAINKAITLMDSQIPIVNLPPMAQTHILLTPQTHLHNLS